MTLEEEARRYLHLLGDTLGTEGGTMYETFMNTVRTFFGSGLWRTALALAVPVVVLALVAWSSPAFRKWCGRMREAGSWRSMLVAIPTGIVKLLTVLVFARLIIVAMVLQAQMFEIKHGNLTEANRSAVLMKWGYPHAQREPSASFTEERFWVTRQLIIPGVDKQKNTVIKESFWKDDYVPVQAIDGGLVPESITREQKRNVSVTQKGIEEVDVELVLTADKRELGGAYYAGYQDLWKIQVLVVNRHDKLVTAAMYFPLPAKTGKFSNVKILVDGKNIADKTSASEQGVRWTMPMEPGQKSLVVISYEGRGLEYLRYIPRQMTQRGHYRVAATITNIKPNEMDWCIGSMPPDQDIRKVTGMPYELTWTLDNTLTSYDVGIKLPEAKQPNYHVARLLTQAPVGLILLLVLLILPRIVVGRPVAVTVIALMSTGYYLLYTFMGRLADVIPYFVLPFLISAVVVSGFVAFLRLRDKSSWMLSRQDTLAFVALAVLYPLAVVDVGRTALWMQIFYLAILLYVCVLVVCFRIAPAMKGNGNLGTPPEGSHE